MSWIFLKKFESSIQFRRLCKILELYPKYFLSYGFGHNFVWPSELYFSIFVIPCMCMSKIERCSITPSLECFFEMSYFVTLFTGCNVTFSGLISSIDIYTALTSRCSLCLIPTEPVFYWVLKMCKWPLEIAWFVTYRWCHSILCVWTKYSS